MTPIEPRTNYPNLMSLEGATLDDAYVLGQCLGADERTVIFKAQVKGGDPAAAIIKIYRAEPSVADEQIALWEEIKKLQHPNLAVVLGSGRTKLQAEELIFVAVEPADEMLDAVLRERPLNANEAGELVVSISRGLEHLHASGFVHGSLSPEEVLGVSDSIKLSTEGARKAQSANDIWLKDAKYRAPESPNGNITPQADVWCLGATLFEALTQKECGTDCRNETARLPVPFGSIVHRCLYTDPENRCTLQEVMKLYEGRLRTFSAAAGAAAGASSGAREFNDAPRSSSPSPVRTDAEPSQFHLPNKSPTRVIQSERAGQLPGRIWAYLAVGLLLLLAVIWLAWPKKSAQRGNVTSSATNRPVSQPRPLTPAEKTARTQREQALRQHARPQVRSSSTPTAPAGSTLADRDQPRQSASDRSHYVNGPIWRVVVYTSDGAEAAETRVRSINEKHPDLKAEVFTPNGSSGPYLVVVGGQMDRENAIALRQKAPRLGLPRDTYVQNYKQ